MENYLNSHSIPFLLPISVSWHVVKFRKDEQENDQDVDDEEMRVACMIKRRVFRMIDIGCDDVAELHTHLMEISKCPSKQVDLIGSLL